MGLIFGYVAPHSESFWPAILIFLPGLHPFQLSIGIRIVMLSLWRLRCILLALLLFFPARRLKLIPVAQSMLSGITMSLLVPTASRPDYLAIISGPWA